MATAHYAGWLTLPQSKQVGLGLLYKINGKELLGAGLKKHVAVTSVR